MSRYELLNKVKDAGFLANLVSSGCVSLSLTVWLTYYEYYLQYLAGSKKSNAVKAVADEFNVSDRLIYKVIIFFES